MLSSRLSRICAAALLSLAVVPLSHATESAAPSNSASAVALPPVVQKIAGAEAHGEERFDTSAGLVGWVVAREGSPDSLVLTTADGKYALVGHLFGPDGHDLTASYFNTYVREPLWPRVEGSSFIAEGPANPKRVLYVVMDPNCIFCHLLWVALQPYESEGLQVRWIPVGIIKPDSPEKAAAILQAADPVAELRQAETAYVEKTESAGVAPIAPTPATLARLASNLALSRQLGMMGTPMVLYRDGATGRLSAISGLPKLGSLGALLDLPQQPLSDPSFKRFW
jgi:thiol:disulfide interchange protein DsbG